jgi:hypothetical protein
VCNYWRLGELKLEYRVPSALQAAATNIWGVMAKCLLGILWGKENSFTRAVGTENGCNLAEMDSLAIPLSPFSRRQIDRLYL